MAPYLKNYIAQLQAQAEEARRAHEAKAEQERKAAIGNTVKPLTLQIEELMRSLPPAQRDRPWSMDDLVGRLQGRYHAQPSAGDVGEALRALGWVRKRDWTIGHAGRRIWIQLEHQK